MPSKRPLTPGDWLTLITERAPAMRKAGVLRVDLDGVEFQLAPLVPDSDVVNGDGVPAPELDPWDDPASYPGGRVPGFEKLHPRAPSSSDT